MFVKIGEKYEKEYKIAAATVATLSASTIHYEKRENTSNIRTI